MKYDIIGDVHGCAETLTALLEKLEYRKENSTYSHPSRQVIFLGDFIDRGPNQRETIDIVRPMIENKSALAVMGNHEFNAIAYATPKPNGSGYLREHSEKNRKQHYAFLKAYEDSDDYEETIHWFKTLPLWIDSDYLKVIHACWDLENIKRIRNSLNGENLLNESFIKLSSTKGTWQYEALETILKGKEILLPKGTQFFDKDGNPRHQMRVRWWDDKATTFKDAFLGPDAALTHIPDDEIEGDHLITYAHDLPPVFLGHYWLANEPEPLAKNIGCVDYSVGNDEGVGKLVAYRWDGEATLEVNKFVSVDRVDGPNIKMPD